MTRISLGSCSSLSIDPHAYDDSSAAEMLICSTDLLFPNSRWFLPLRSGDSYNTNIVYGLLDTGSSRSFIGATGLSLIRYWQIKFQDIQNFTVVVANGNSENVSTKLIVIACLEDRRVELTLFYLPSLAAPMLLGIDFLRSMELCLDCQGEEWWFQDQPNVKFHLISGDTEAPMPDTFVDILSCGVKTLTPIEKDSINKVVSEGIILLNDVPGLTTMISHKIDTGDNLPIKQRPYRYSPKVLEAMYAELDKLLSEGKVEPSHSAWASPVVMVRKGDGYRMTIDYRKVNLVSKKRLVSHAELELSSR